MNKEEIMRIAKLNEQNEHDQIIAELIRRHLEENIDGICGPIDISDYADAVATLRKDYDLPENEELMVRTVMLRKMDLGFLILVGYVIPPAMHYLYPRMIFELIKLRLPTFTDIAILPEKK